MCMLYCVHYIVFFLVSTTAHLRRAPLITRTGYFLYGIIICTRGHIVYITRLDEYQFVSAMRTPATWCRPRWREQTTTLWRLLATTRSTTIRATREPQGIVYKAKILCGNIVERVMSLTQPGAQCVSLLRQHQALNGEGGCACWHWALLTKSSIGGAARSPKSWPVSLH
jgi:hypothetical protein